MENIINKQELKQIIKNAKLNAIRDGYDQYVIVDTKDNSLSTGRLYTNVKFLDREKIVAIILISVNETITYTTMDDTNQCQTMLNIYNIPLKCLYMNETLSTEDKIEYYKQQIEDFINNNENEDADLLGHLTTLKTQNTLEALEEAIEIITNNE